MAGDDRLSALVDDLLLRILYFVPFKEAAATSVLSRRWVSLWRSSGAVNLDVRVHEDKSCNLSYQQKQEGFFSRRDAFYRAALAALDATDTWITRLTLRVDVQQDSAAYNFLHGTIDPSEYVDVIGDVVSHCAALGVEELRVVVATAADDLFSASHQEDPERPSDYIYGLTLPPWIHLRVLDLTRCTGLAPPATNALPLLETLRLRLCSLNTVDVQALMDAAPRLATVHLEAVFFMGGTEEGALGVRLRCRAVTELVMELCGMEETGGCRSSIEIDAPRLRYLRYKGSERPFSLTSLAPGMVEVNLHFIKQTYPHLFGLNPEKIRVLFWQFVRNFTNARVLKLKVNDLEDIAVAKARRTELLCTFHNAMRLELQGVHHGTSKAAAVAIANLLRCCPALSDLRLKLSTVPSNSFIKGDTYGKAFLERKDRTDYDKSVSRFMHRHRSANSLDRNDNLDEVPGDIPGLSGHSLTCLQSSLRRVGLQFRMGNSSCFGTQLAKFFTDNAKVLQEICVDSGNRKLDEHMLNVERWIAPTSSKVCLKRKNLAESSWEFSEIPAKRSPNSRTDITSLATSLTVLPLKR